MELGVCPSLARAEERRGEESLTKRALTRQLSTSGGRVEVICLLQSPAEASWLRGMWSITAVFGRAGCLCRGDRSMQLASRCVCENGARLRIVGSLLVIVLRLG